MTTPKHGSPNSIMVYRTVVAGLVILLAILLAIGYVWIQTDQVLAPPGVRVMDGLWRLLTFWK